MRKGLAVAVLLGAAALAWGQPEPPPPRYGIPANPEIYPQGTPKDALASAIKAIDRGKADYLAAHLIDPRFIDAKVDDRARLIEKAVEAELRARQEAQRENPATVPAGERLPLDPKGFAEAVRREAALRAFRQVVADIHGTLAENPDHLKDFRRFARAGQFTDLGETATATLPDVKDRQISFRRVGDRWFVEDGKRPEQPAKK